MTYAEIENLLHTLYEDYREGSQRLTGVQMPGFDAQFAKKNNVIIQTGWGVSIELVTPVIIDDFSEVRDVGFTFEEIGFWTKKQKRYPHIVLENGFHFSTKSNVAFKLMKGDRIRFSGKVRAYISSYEGPSVSINPQSTFSIEFSNS